MGSAAGAVLLAAALFGGSVAMSDSSTPGRKVTIPPTPPTKAEPDTTVPDTASPTVPAMVTISLASPRITAAAPTTQHGTARKPVYAEGVPQVRVMPRAGKAGDRLRVDGYGFTGEQWAAPNAPLWLVAQSGCGLYAPTKHSLRVSPGGHLSGELTVPARGECRQSDRSDEPVLAGRYRIAFSCTACFIGSLEVTTSRSPAAT